MDADRLGIGIKHALFKGQIGGELTPGVTEVTAAAEQIYADWSGQNQLALTGVALSNFVASALNPKNQGNAILGMQLQYTADLAFARGDKIGASRLGRDAAIQLGIQEQKVLQKVLWDDGIISTSAMIMAAGGMISAEIPIPALGQDAVIDPPGARQGIFGGKVNPFPRVWDLNYRIGIARNGFNKLYDWVHAPSARGDQTNANKVRDYVERYHWNNRQYVEPRDSNDRGRNFGRFY